MNYNGKIKVALYCRVASEAQLPKTALYCRVAAKDDLAAQQQEARLRRFAAENGFQNLCIYNDNGEAGTTLNRPAMKRLIADIKTGEVQTVIVTNVDRIARGWEPFVEWIHLLKNTNVKCVAIDLDEKDFSREFSFRLDLYQRHFRE